MRHKTPPWIFEEPPTLAELERMKRRCRLHEISSAAASKWCSACGLRFAVDAQLPMVL